jgi:hypothetical protein
VAFSDTDYTGCVTDGSMRRFLQKDHRRVTAGVCSRSHRYISDDQKDLIGKEGAGFRSLGEP